jgi:very-short-patch-repair endonuclease
MVWSTEQTSSSPWALAREQHGVVARRQLLELGLSPRGIEHRLARGRLHPVGRGVYVVGRGELSPQGRRMAAILACRSTAVLSHRSAAATWGIGRELRGVVEITLRASTGPRRPGLRVYRQPGLKDEEMVLAPTGVPVTNVVRTLIDLAVCLDEPGLDRAIREADRLGLVDPEALRLALCGRPGQKGVRRLRDLLDRRTFRLTDSELERRFLRLVQRAGLKLPLTQQEVDGFRVDFLWPELEIVVETDGLRYHRTPVQQARDLRRDQAHTAAGRVPLRFSHAQVYFEAEQVAATLVETHRRRRVDLALAARHRTPLPGP